MLETRGEMAVNGDERSPLLHPNDRRLSKLVHEDEEADSIIRSHVSVEERKLADSTIGERLPYNDYTTIDWLHDLVSYHEQRLTVLIDKIPSGQGLVSRSLHPQSHRSPLQVLEPLR